MTRKVFDAQKIVLFSELKNLDQNQIPNFCCLGFDPDSFFEVVPYLMAHYLVKYLTVIWHFTYGIIYGMSFFQNDFLRTQNTNQDHEKSCMYDPLNNGS